MTKLKVALATAALSLVMLVGSANPALAWLAAGDHVVYPNEGGQWDYGFWNAYARSYYWQGSRCHGSTVQFNGGGGWGTVRSIDTAAGHQSIAEIPAYNSPWSDDRYYYRVC